MANTVATALMIAVFLLKFIPGQAQADYDYTFYPEPHYTKHTRSRGIDTTSQAVVWKTDSIGAEVAVKVEKRGDRLTLSNLRNSSNNLYSERVLYIGIDQNQCLMYEAQTAAKEIVTINPVLGFVLVTFTDCTGFKFKTKENPGDCDRIMYCFGQLRDEYRIR